MDWLKKRFAEKSTQSALLGVVSSMLMHYGVDNNLSLSLSTLIMCILFGYSITEG